jgi:hypothetical protein
MKRPWQGAWGMGAPLKDHWPVPPFACEIQPSSQDFKIAKSRR